MEEENVFKLKNTKMKIYIFTAIICIIWFSLFYILRKILITNFIFIDVFILFLPIVLILIYLNETIIFLENNSPDIVQESILKNLDNMKNFSLVIPTIVFGLGFFLHKDLKKKSLYYFLLALIFGAIFPFLIVKIFNKNKDLETLIVLDLTEYSSLSFGYTLLLPGLLFPIFIYYNKYLKK